MLEDVETMTDETAPRGLWARMMRAKPAKPGELYGVPGQGSSFILSLATIAFLLFIWWLVTAMGWVKPLFVPSPGAIVSEFIGILQGGFTGNSLFEHVWISTLRVFGAFLLACAVGIPLGLAMGMSPVMRGIFDPPIEFYRPIPPLAYLPLMIIWFGIGPVVAALIVFLMCFFPILVDSMSGFRAVDPRLFYISRSMGATRWQSFWKFRLPAAMPAIFSGMKIGVVKAVEGVIIAEFIASNKGLGFMIMQASSFMDMSLMFAGLIAAAIVALIFNGAMGIAERVLMPWGNAGH